MDLEVEMEGNELNELVASFPPLEGPPVHFVTENNTVVTSQTGSTSLVPCIINNIGDGMVSWIRRKDYHLLTVGLTTYSSDDRFQAIHLQHSEDWTLQIKFVQQRDAGLYECQVSSHPPISIFVQLNVVEAKGEIQGPSEKYLKPGSGLRLQCTVLQSTEAPSYVFWYHNNRMINYDVDRGINVTTDLAEKMSVLTITNAATRHSGNYSCVPSNAQPASTYVHILNENVSKALIFTLFLPSVSFVTLTYLKIFVLFGYKFYGGYLFPDSILLSVLQAEACICLIYMLKFKVQVKIQQLCNMAEEGSLGCNAAHRLGC